MSPTCFEDYYVNEEGRVDNNDIYMHFLFHGAHVLKL